MKLTVTKKDKFLIIHQDGGYTPYNKALLKTIAKDPVVVDGVYWYYTFSPGFFPQLEQVANETGAELEIDPSLDSYIVSSKEKIQKELEVRKTLQAYMDDPSLSIGSYPTRQDPPPWRHQMIAYHWGMRVDNLYIAHKPGLGKTRTATDLIAGRIRSGQVRRPESFYVPEHEHPYLPYKIEPAKWAIRGGVLVVTPKGVIGTWHEELMLWQNIKNSPIYGSTKQKKKRRLTPAWVYITSYGGLEKLLDFEFDGVIFDEAHYLASAESKRTQHALHIREKARWILTMSGTPVSNMLPSLWSQYYILDYGLTLGPNFKAYERDYFQKENRKYIAKTHAQSTISKAISRITYFLTMPEAFPDKKHKIQQIEEVALSKEQAEYYQTVHDSAVAQIQSADIMTEAIQVKMIKLLQICQGFIIDDDGKVHRITSTKLKRLRDMIVKGDLSNTRLLIWCQFKFDLIQVVKMLKEEGIPTLWLHGKMSNTDREKVKYAWNNDPNWQVCVSMIQIGIGINLHAPTCKWADGTPARCSTAVYYGYNYSVTQLEQSMDRIYRGNQVETCLYRFLITRDIDYTLGGRSITPIDARIYEVLQEKLTQATELAVDSIDYARKLLLEKDQVIEGTTGEGPGDSSVEGSWEAGGKGTVPSSSP